MSTEKVLGITVLAGQSKKNRLEYSKACKQGNLQRTVVNISVVKPRQKVVPIEAW